MMIRQLIDIFHTALRSCRAEHLLPGLLAQTQEQLIIDNHYIQKAGTGRLCVIAVGKAAAAMAAETEKIFGSSISVGLCVTKYFHALPLERIVLIEAAHPEPDQNSLLAGSQVLRLLQGLTENDVVLFLISGGASSLITDLPDGADAAELKEGYRLLVNCGAPINEINCVRKHLSRIKGGQLARAAFPAHVLSLLISDVPGDDLQTIGSGPTVPDPTTYQDALGILEKYGLLEIFPGSLLKHLQKGSLGLLEETPKPGDPVFRTSFTHIIANNQKAAETAAEEAAKLGFYVHRDESIMTGNTDEEAIAFARKLICYDGPLPALFIKGGETTLKVTGKGKGGRNQHFALRVLHEMKLEWKSKLRFAILSAGTDGTDGPTDAAGALIHSKMLSGPGATILRIREHLNHFNAYHFFSETGGLLKTGPTQTNVMDLVIGIIY